MSLEVYRRFNLPLLYWKRVGDNPNDWKGPHKKGWNDPKRVYDLHQYDPSVHNLGVFTGREISPSKYLTDVDFDKLKDAFVQAFFPPSAFALTRPGKPLSHLLYTAPTPLKGRKQYKALSDDKPYIELRGLGFQTMLSPSLHTPPDIRVALLKADAITHVDELRILEDATLDYAIASLVVDVFPGGLHHDARLALAGYLLKRQFDEGRVAKLLQTICAYQVECRIPDMSRYDVDDGAVVVETTAARLKKNERVEGSTFLKEVNADFVKRLQSWLPHLEGGVTVDDFYAYMPKHNYLFIPSREFWPASSVNARIFPIAIGTNEKGEEESIPANVWLDRHRPVEQLTWAPGKPLLIPDRLVAEGGWIDRPGCACVNLYRPPTIAAGDAQVAALWLELLCFVYPNDADHLVAWFAHRVQRPQEKINHALVFGGVPGIGKDSILEPVKSAVGPWNFADVSPTVLLGRFNGFVKSVILRVSEVRDLGEMSRYAFYEHMKIYTAAPPDVLRVDEKNIPEHAVFNVCGVVYTTNHETDGMYLPQDDRRHYVTWSSKTPADFSEGYWKTLYHWYDNGGRGHVAAYLASFDLSRFDPKAPPKKTEAFWAIVDANRPTEDAELADALDALADRPVKQGAEPERPRAITLELLANICMPDLSSWLLDRRNSRQIPHRMKTAGYAPYRNPDAKDGQWKIGKKRQTVYVQEGLTVPERDAAAKALQGKFSEAPAPAGALP
jgi:hypothetical protein